MPRRNPLQNISTSGGLLTADFLQSVREKDFNHQLIQPKTFSLPKTPIQTQKELDRHINDAWEKLKARWDTISLKLKEMDVKEARKRWIEPLLRELGFNFVKASAPISLEDGSIQIYLSHRGWWEDDAPKIHTVFPEHDLDKRRPTDRNDKSPHDALQLYLNLDKTDQKWAILTNGILLRLLHDFYHTYTRGYVEFDLENIFNEHNVTDFRTLFRLAHASRFRLYNGTIPLEKFFLESVAAGVKIGEDLRYNVKEAIEQLGNGLLTRKWRKKMVVDPELTKQFYQEILKIIYRILFLMFAEQRGMMPMRDSLYAEQYSLTRLRERAESRILKESHFDLWYGLKATFTLVREGSDKLRVFGYNGELFEDTDLEIISSLRCRNDILLRVIKYLTCYQKGKILQRINFLDIGVEEIGSIYESLLDFTPRVLKSAETIENRECSKGQFILDPLGASRKTTGSYYTDHHLIDELIDSALKPVLENALDSTGSSIEEKENALLGLKVCDPACGSGAFLIAANNFLGKELAQIRTGEEFPPDSEERAARRDVLSHCIFGVDLNPMAAELAKVSLWINACVKDLPLNFMDHRIKQGNSVIGGKLHLIKKGIPSIAYKAVLNEDKDIARELKKINDKQRKPTKVNKQKVKHALLDKFFTETEKMIDVASFKRLSSIAEYSKDDIYQKRELYRELLENQGYLRQKLIFDTLVAPFFWPFIESFKDAPTQGTLSLLIDGSLPFDRISMLDKINDIATDFFHWHLEFPEVFSGSRTGFDCIIGNPPWERIKIQKKEFFSARSPEIANVRTAAERNRLINELEQKNPQLKLEFESALLNFYKMSNFFRNSGSFKLTGRGDINLCPLFAENCLNLLNKGGRLGMVLKTGVISDFYMQEFTQDLVTKKKIISIIDFTNRKKIFPDVVANERFMLFTGTKSGYGPEEITISILNETLVDIKNQKKRINLKYGDITLLNPNTRTIPFFSNRKDLDLCLKLYRNNPVLIKQEKDQEENTWQIEYLRMFDMANDSKLFRDKEWLVEKGFKKRVLGYFESADERFIQLYEGKLFNIYDSRFGSFENIPRKKRFGTKAEPNHPNEEEKANIDYEIEPRYWINESAVKSRYSEKKIPEDAIFVFRNICRSYTDSRTARGALIPPIAVAHSAAVLIFRQKDIIERIKSEIAFAAIFNSFTFDFISRLKLGSVNFSKFILEQICAPQPSVFEKIYAFRENKKTALEWIVDLAPSLAYNTVSMAKFFKPLGVNKPIPWSSEERHRNMCFIDAIIAHLYGLSLSDYKYIFTRFPILKNQEETKFGEFKSRRYCLEFFDSIEKS